MLGNAAGTVHHFIDRMFHEEVEVVGVVYVDYRHGFSRRQIELAEIHGDVDLAVVITKIAMMIVDGNLPLDLAGSVGLHQLRGEAPEKIAVVVAAGALQMLLVGAGAGDFVRRPIFNGA